MVQWVSQLDDSLPPVIKHSVSYRSLLFSWSLLPHSLRFAELEIDRQRVRNDRHNVSAYVCTTAAAHLIFARVDSPDSIIVVTVILALDTRALVLSHRS